MDDFLKWVDKNPVLAGGIGLGGVLLLLWWMGFFTSSSSASSGAGNMAAAYYAAEAAQTTAGTQLQMATVQATNATAQVGLQAQAAEAIAATQATRDTTIAQYGAGVATANVNDAMQTTIATANITAAQNAAHDNAMNFNDYINHVLPATLASSGNYAAIYNFPGQAASVGFAPGSPGPNQMRAAGYSEATIAAVFGP
jgi:hypothetical protein